MIRRDYVKFAEMLEHKRRAYEDDIEASRALYNTMTAIADIFAHDNKRFNRERFYRACEPKGGKRD